MIRTFFLGFILSSTAVVSTAQHLIPRCDTCRWTDLAQGLDDLSDATEWLGLFPNDHFTEDNAQQIGYLRQIRGFVCQNNPQTLNSLAKHLTQVVSVDLRVSVDTLVADAAAWTQLQQLHLNGKLPHLCSGVGAWQCLQSLRAKGIQLQQLPEGVGHWNMLQEADLSNNQLVDLPVAVGQWRAVETLLLSGNPLKELPTSVGNWTALKKLTLYSTTKRVDLPKEIKNWKNLEVWEVDWETFANADRRSLRGLQRLHTLIFKTIPSDQLALLQQQVSVLPALRTLVFSSPYQETDWLVLTNNRWDARLDMRIKTTIDKATQVQDGSLFARIKNLKTLEIYSSIPLPDGSMQQLWQAPKLQQLTTNLIVLAAATGSEIAQRSSSLTDLSVVIQKDVSFPIEAPLPSFPRLQKLRLDVESDALIPTQLFSLEPQDSLYLAAQPSYNQSIPLDCWHKPIFRYLSDVPFIPSAQPLSTVFMATSKQADLTHLSQQSNIKKLILTLTRRMPVAALDLTRMGESLGDIAIHTTSERLELVAKNADLAQLNRLEIRATQCTVTTDLQALPAVSYCYLENIRWEGVLPLMPKLERLRLQNISSAELSAHLFQSPFLKKMDLEGMALKSVPEALKDAAFLESVSLSYNELSTIPDWLLQLPRLEVLALWGNPIPIAEIRALRKKMPQVKILF